jgi:adenosylcobinamide-GDP ribazoletransferase
MKHFLIALQFLTIFPVSIKQKLKNRDFGKALLYFPIVGLIIGIILAVTASIFSFLPPLVTAAIILTTSIILTGGLHLDGFADSCDGLYGNWPKERILTIMKDSNIGAMGVIGLICLLLFKFTLIVSIPTQILWKSLIVMAAFSRWVQTFACAFSTYPRENGKAKLFVTSSKKINVIVSGIITFIAAILMLQLKIILPIVFTFILVCLFMAFVKKKIGGMTGDTIGAVSEITETGILFFILLLCL